VFSSVIRLYKLEEVEEGKKVVVLVVKLMFFSVMSIFLLFKEQSLSKSGLIP